MTIDFTRIPENWQIYLVLMILWGIVSPRGGFFGLSVFLLVAWFYQK